MLALIVTTMTVASSMEAGGWNCWKPLRENAYTFRLCIGCPRYGNGAPADPQRLRRSMSWATITPQSRPQIAGAWSRSWGWFSRVIFEDFGTQKHVIAMLSRDGLSLSFGLIDKITDPLHSTSRKHGKLKPGQMRRSTMGTKTPCWICQLIQA